MSHENQALDFAIDVLDTVANAARRVPSLDAKIADLEKTLRSEVARADREASNARSATARWNGERQEADTLRSNIERLQESERLATYNQTQAKAIARQEVAATIAAEHAARSRADSALGVARLDIERLHGVVNRLNTEKETLQVTEQFLKDKIEAALAALLKAPDILDSDTVTKADIKALRAALVEADAILREGTVPATQRHVIEPPQPDGRGFTPADLTGEQKDRVVVLAGTDYSDIEARIAASLGIELADLGRRPGSKEDKAAAYRTLYGATPERLVPRGPFTPTGRLAPAPWGQDHAKETDVDTLDPLAPVEEVGPVSRWDVT